MGSKKKNNPGSSHAEKSPKQSQSNEQQKNGTKHRKQSPNSSSPGSKQSEKSKCRTSTSGTKPSEKTKSRSSSSGKWILFVVLSSLVAGGAVLYTSPEAQKLIDDLMLKYFHPDILSAVHSFIETTKSAIPSKTSTETDSSAKTQTADKGGKSNREENVDRSEKIPKSSTEQTQPKQKEKEPEKKTGQKPESKTKPSDKSVTEQTESKHTEKTDSRETKPQHKEKKPMKEQTQSEQKDKQEGSVSEKKTAQEQKQSKAKPDDKLAGEDKKSKEIHDTKASHKPETPEPKTKPDDKLKQEDEKSKGVPQSKTDKKPDIKTKSNDELKQEDKKSKDVPPTKTDKKSEIKTKPTDNLKQEDKKSKDVPPTKTDQKPEIKKSDVKSKQDDKKLKAESDPKTNQKPKTEAKSDDKLKPDNKEMPETKTSKKPETKAKPDDKLKPDDKEMPETKTSKKPEKTETTAKPDDKSRQEHQKSKEVPDNKTGEQRKTKNKLDDKEQKRESVKKQDGRQPDSQPEQVDSDKTADSQEKEKQKKKTSVDKSDKKSSKTQSKATYAKASITNSADNVIRKLLDEADSTFEQKQYETALEKFEDILKKYPKSPRALYGKALTLNELAEQFRSNEILEKGINILTDFLDVSDVPDELYKMAGRKLSERQQFRGWGGKASKTLLKLTQRFPGDIQLKNDLGVSYLMIGRNDPAQAIFEDVLKIDPSNGFAMVHLGFIVKTIKDDLDTGIQLLADGIATNQPGTADGRFYFHLGDALQRKNRTEEAYRYYRDGAAKKIFLSEYQRSLYNVNYLTGRPWWTNDQTGYNKYIKLLEDNWEIIRDEGLAQLDGTTGAFLPEDENLREKGTWKQFTLYSQGRRNHKACEKAPKTCALIDQIPDAKSCTRGQTKFSVMKPGVHVWPHCGPTNCRIRAHLGLVIPPGPKIRVTNDTREWKEGKVIIFDDSFEHEVWHDGNETRLVLIVDFWHPELTADLKRTLTPI